MQRRNLLILSLTLTLTACERGQVISSETIDLSATPVRISMERSGVSVGPTRQVCLTMAPNDADSIEGGRNRPLAYRTPIHVVLITKEGLQDTLGGSNGASDIRLDAHTLCIWDHGLSAPHLPPLVLDSGRTILAAKPLGPPRRAEYIAMEIWSDRPLHVDAVRWWTGQRTAFL